MSELVAVQDACRANATQAALFPSENVLPEVRHPIPDPLLAAEAAMLDASPLFWSRPFSLSTHRNMRRRRCGRRCKLSVIHFIEAASVFVLCSFVSQ